MSRAVEELNRRLLRARDAMDRAYAERLDVRAVAAVARLSEAHFIRSFRGCFGETPHRYLQRQRHSDPAAGEGGGSSFVTTVPLSLVAAETTSTTITFTILVSAGMHTMAVIVFRSCAIPTRGVAMRSGGAIDRSHRRPCRFERPHSA
jgi:hypothetical protein